MPETQLELEGRAKARKEREMVESVFPSRVDVEETCKVKKVNKSILVFVVKPASRN